MTKAAERKKLRRMSSAKLMKVLFDPNLLCENADDPLYEIIWDLTPNVKGRRGKALGLFLKTAQKEVRRELQWRAQ